MTRTKKKILIAVFVLPLWAQQTLEKEQALGKHLAAEMRRRSKPLGNPRVEEYARRIGSRLAPHGPGLAYNFEIIVDSAEVTDSTEPMPLPGGPIFIPAAFLLAVRDEAEFAGMLAHSIAHAALRHGTRSQPEAQTPGMAGIPLIFMGGWGLHADSRSRTLVPAGFLALQRENELEADKLAIAITSRAGYDPAALRTYVQRVHPADSPGSSFALRQLRLANLDELLRDTPLVGSSNEEDFVRMQEAVRETTQPSPQRKAPPTLRR